MTAGRAKKPAAAVDLHRVFPRALRSHTRRRCHNNNTRTRAGGRRWLANRLHADTVRTATRVTVVVRVRGDVFIFVFPPEMLKRFPVKPLMTRTNATRESAEAHVGDIM